MLIFFLLFCTSAALELSYVSPQRIDIITSLYPFVLSACDNNGCTALKRETRILENVFAPNWSYANVTVELKNELGWVVNTSTARIVRPVDKIEYYYHLLPFMIVPTIIIAIFIALRRHRAVKIGYETQKQRDAQKAQKFYAN